MTDPTTGPSASDLARRLVEVLLARGAAEAVLAPGSRSGPLALALHAADAQGLLRLHVRVDEREAGFLALGLAKVSRTVVPVVTTSGTAVANLHPAMLEALHAGVPVLAVTADRPGRLRGTGANQTTDQRRIFPGLPFGDRVDELPLPLGPAHLNLELDEPLVETVDWVFDVDAPSGADPISSGAAAVSSGAVSRDTPSQDRQTAPGPQALRCAPCREGPPAGAPGIVTALEPGPRTVVVAGDDARQAARILARDAGWPLLAEPTSGSRCGEALVSYRLLLDHEPLAGRIERVVSLGHPTLSRPITRLLGREDVDVVHVGGPATFPLVAGPRVTFTDALALGGPGDPEWYLEWQRADARATAAVDAVVSERADAEVYRVARAVSEAVPPGGMLFVGASNPIRDLDLVARPYPAGERRLVVANRGLSGIDGTLSSAIGAALARQRRHPGSAALAVMGDLTFLHGANGLLIGPTEPRPDLTVVVTNDDGGSIFAGLEQGAPEHAAAFERVYATSTGTDLSALCRAHDIEHRRVPAAELPARLAEPVVGLRVLEVPVGRGGRRDLAAHLARAARGALESP